MMKEHWEHVYQKSSVDKLGWYEARSEPSLKLIERCKLEKDAAILNVGAGATTLVMSYWRLDFRISSQTILAAQHLRNFSPDWGLNRATWYGGLLMI